MLHAITILSPVIIGVLAVLIFFSIASWVVMINKYLLIKTIRKNTKTFVDFFWDTKDFALIDQKTTDTINCPVATVFKEGYRETLSFAESGTATDAAAGNSGFRRLSADIGTIENISRSLRKIASMEIAKIEKDIGFLATTASTTPFIGLFGTVWGIMNAFGDIGRAGSTSLAIVAPGISEALVTTAIGLAAAIPAGIGFNHFQSEIRSLVSDIDNFSSDFLNIVQKTISNRS